MTANIVLTHQLIVNKNSDVIDGGTNHFGIDANGSRGLVVQGGRVTLENLSITNATALGGAESHLDCRAAT